MYPNRKIGSETSLRCPSSIFFPSFLRTPPHTINTTTRFPQEIFLGNLEFLQALGVKLNSMYSSNLVEQFTDSIWASSTQLNELYLSLLSLLSLFQLGSDLGGGIGGSPAVSAIRFFHHGMRCPLFDAFPMHTFSDQPPLLSSIVLQNLYSSI